MLYNSEEIQAIHNFNEIMNHFNIIFMSEDFINFLVKKDKNESEQWDNLIKGISFHLDSIRNRTINIKELNLFNQNSINFFSQYCKNNLNIDRINIHKGNNSFN